MGLEEDDSNEKENDQEKTDVDDINVDLLSSFRDRIFAKILLDVVHELRSINKSIKRVAEEIEDK